MTKKFEMYLNNLPTYQNGTHERIFSSMLCGAISITNDFPIMHDEFTDSENIIFYSNSQLDILVQKINNLLSSPIEAQEIALKGKYIAEQSHTWEHNAIKILELIKK